MADCFTMQVPGNPFSGSGPAFNVGNHPVNSQGASSSFGLDTNGVQMSEGVFNVSKRRRMEEDAMEGSPLRQCQCGQSAEITAYRGRRFVPITGCDKIYHSENVKPKGETVYLPLIEDILINMNNIEQVSFANGLFFLGDQSGNYARTDQGYAINLWRFDASSKHLYISRSLLFLDIMMFNEVKGMLQCM